MRYMHTLLLFFLFYSSITLYAMQENTGVIRDAAFYVYEGKGRVTFYKKWENVRNDNFDQQVVGEGCVKTWDIETQKKMDDKIDPKVKLISITRAEIDFDSRMLGRYVAYYDGDKFVESIGGYSGPTDIKNNTLGANLIRPTLLLSNLKKVEEGDDALPLQSLIGWFYPSYRWHYIKKRVIYHDDDNITEVATWTHRAVQGTYTVLGLGVLYGVGHLLLNQSDFFFANS